MKSGLMTDLLTGRVRNVQRQRRDLKPAWGNAPGRKRPISGLKARPMFAPIYTTAKPNTRSPDTQINRAVGACGTSVPVTWAFGPCWYKTGLWPINTVMPQSLSLVVIHVIFSTKDRRPFLDPDTCPNLHAYLATVARNAGCECYRVGGVADHVHLAIRLSRTLTIANLVENLKTSSSKWLKTRSPSLASFSWQRGYGCFSVGPTDLESLCAYIDRQEEHHRTRTFQDEFQMFLKKYGVEYGEAYVWD
jgi:REP element-mobilizing transposase RayT